MTWITNNTHLYRSIVIYGVIGTLFISLAVAVVSIVPLYLRLKASSEDRIIIAAGTKAEVISARLTNFSDVADQIASRSAVRDELLAFSQGKISREEMVAVNEPKLTDALQQSQSLAGIQQLDFQGNLVIQVGQPIPVETIALFQPPLTGPVERSPQPVNIQGELYLVSARQILGGEKRPVGAEFFIFKTNEFQEVAGDNHALGKSAVVVIERMQPIGIEPLISSRPLTEQENAIHQQAIGQLIHQKNALFDLASASVLIAAAEADATRWFITVQIDKGDLYAKVRTQVYRVAALAALLVALGTGGMIFLLRPLAQGMRVHDEELEQLVTEKAKQYLAEYEERLAIEQDLRLINTRYQSVVQTARDAIILADQEGKIIDWNSAAEKILGYPSSEMIGQPLGRIIPDRVQAGHKFAFQTFIQDPAAFQRRSRGQWPAQRKDGSEFPADISLSLFELDGGNYLAVILRDISEMRSIETALSQSQARYKSMIEDVVDASSVAMCITDSQFNVVWENLAAVKMWQLDRNKVIGGDKRKLLMKHIAEQIDDGEAFVQTVLNSYTTDQHLENVEIHFPVKSGRNERWVMYSSKPIRVGYYARGRIEQYVDITEQKQLLAKIEHLAMTDDLTGIYNRRGLSELGNRDLARSHSLTSPLCSIFLDIDHFKDLNDRYGHASGDRILKELTQRIQNHTREMDLFTRYGGEEFVILLPDTPLEQANQIAERIRCIIADLPFNAGEEPLQVTISVGVSIINSSDDLVSLLKRADQAMYRAKQNGRNRVEWTLS